MAADQLAQALAAKRYAQKQDEFVSNITHEMKSPLAAIKLHAQTLQQEGELPADIENDFGDHRAAGGPHGVTRRRRARKQSSPLA
ncbi:MAG: hypothetical protein HC783_15795 [Rhodobacteraceae bacterium]|nr:hypothetical protein [Paracoccaceae bacterium]